MRVATLLVLPFVLLAAAGSAKEDAPAPVSTRCREKPVTAANGTAMTLGACGEEGAADLLWHLDRIDQLDGRLDGLFHRTNRGAGSVVYIMDTGVLATHQEFSGASGSRVIAGIDVSQDFSGTRKGCRSGDLAVAPCFTGSAELPAASHGTSVASIAAGTNIGVAPDAWLISVRVMNQRGLATTRTYLDGLEAIIRHAWSPEAPPVRTAVVNISGWMLERIGSHPAEVSYSAVEKRMVDMIQGVDAFGNRNPAGKRFLFVVAGNNVDGGCGRSGIVDRFPATLGREIDGVITVGGITPGNEAWGGACRGGVEILAPAQSVFSATITGHDHYRSRASNQRSGTSFAAPIVAGIAAQALASDPDLTPQELEAMIKSSPSRITRADPAHADGRVAYVTK